MDSRRTKKTAIKRVRSYNSSGQDNQKTTMPTTIRTVKRTKLQINQKVFPYVSVHDYDSDNFAVSKNNHKKASEWVVGSEPDDLEAISREDGSLPMEYRLMVAMLLEAKYGNCERFKNIEFVTEFTEYFKNSDEYSIIDLFKNQSQNIKDLYETLNRYPTADYVDGVNYEIHLYRGFDGSRYELLLENMPKEVGKTYTTPTFLSTSVLKNTGLRFAYDNGIVWKIVIPKRNLGKFNYTNLSDKDVDIRDESNTNEAEILLNMGAKLKLKDIKEIENEKYIIPQFMGTSMTRYKTYTLYTFEFMGYEQTKKIQPIIQNTRDKIMSCFEEINPDQRTISGKKRKTKKRKMK